MVIPSSCRSLISKSSLLRRMNPKDWFYQLLARGHGIPREDLDQFLEGDCSPKIPEARPATQEELAVVIGQSLDRGGYLSGGLALARITKTRQPDDADIFFDNPAIWAEFVIRYRHLSTIEFCLFEKRPWETFDINILKLSIGKHGVEAADECRHAISTMRSGLDLVNLTQPSDTIQRCAKYQNRLGIVYDEDNLRIAYALAGRQEDELFGQLIG